MNFNNIQGNLREPGERTPRRSVFQEDSSRHAERDDQMHDRRKKLSLVSDVLVALNNW